MLKTLLALFLAVALPLCAFAGGGAGHVEDIDFPFDGVFGTYDQNQLQRGLKVYTEVCAGCHGLKYVPFRALGQAGGPEFPEDQVRAYAKTFDVFDPELDDFRPAKPADHFPQSSLSTAPDLSLMATARAGFHGPYGLGINQFMKGMGGAEYIVAVLKGYTGKEKEEAGVTFYENTAFPGGWIAMQPPLEDGQVDFDDNHANDAKSMAKDVAAFLMWAADPNLNARKQNGFLNVLFLLFIAVLLYFTNKWLWAPHKGKAASEKES